MVDKIRWGFLGTGYIAQKFAEALEFIPDAELVAVGSRTLPSAEAFAKQYHVPRAHGSYYALVDDPNVDVVYVASVNSWHYKNCLDALQAGKAVLCEKPFMVNAKEAEEVIAFAQEKRLFLMEALWTRFIPAFKRHARCGNQGLSGMCVWLCRSLASFVIEPHRLPFSILSWQGVRCWT